MKKEDMHDYDFDRWGTTPGATFSLDDEPEEPVAKTFSEVIEKFNPFHDARGRFSSSNGMKTYSANPKTKAGQMAIDRSTAAGYGAVMNVHRESKGENIRQNDNWIKSGQKPSPSQLARAQANAPTNVGQMKQNAHTNRVKGTMGATETSTARHPRPTKPQPSQQPKQTQQKPAQTSNHKVADGQDITNKFSYNASSRKSAVQQAAEAQGYTGTPKVVSKKEFNAAVTQTGLVGYRTINGGRDVITGQQKTAQQFKDDLKNSNTFSLNGSGGQVYGGGLYVVTNHGAQPGTNPTTEKSGKQAKSESSMYGGHNSAMVTMTVDPSAKIGSGSKVRQEFNNLNNSQRAKFGHDIGAYATAKGYDGLRWDHAGWNSDYTTIYNRTKLIVLDD